MSFSIQAGSVQGIKEDAHNEFILGKKKKAYLGIFRDKLDMWSLWSHSIRAETRGKSEKRVWVPFLSLDNRILNKLFNFSQLRLSSSVCVGWRVFSYLSGDSQNHLGKCFVNQKTQWSLCFLLCEITDIIMLTLTIWLYLILHNRWIIREEMSMNRRCVNHLLLRKTQLSEKFFYSDQTF